MLQAARQDCFGKKEAQMISFLKSLFTQKESAMKNYTPQEVQKMLKDGSIALIDVREPDEHASERIQGAIFGSIFRFDPHKLPDCGEAVGFPLRWRHSFSQQPFPNALSAGLSHERALAGGGSRLGKAQACRRQNRFRRLGV